MISHQDKKTRRQLKHTSFKALLRQKKKVNFLYQTDLPAPSAQANFSVVA